MTKEEKKERWRVKHDLQAAVRRYHFRDSRFSSTNTQMAQNSKKVADLLLAGRNPKYAQALNDPLGEGLVQVW
jgi:hypothetical protein